MELQKQKELRASIEEARKEAAAHKAVAAKAVGKAAAAKVAKAVPAMAASKEAKEAVAKAAAAMATCRAKPRAKATAAKAVAAKAATMLGRWSPGSKRSASLSTQGPPGPPQGDGGDDPAGDGAAPAGDGGDPLGDAPLRQRSKHSRKKKPNRATSRAAESKARMISVQIGRQARVHFSLHRDIPFDQVTQAFQGFSGMAVRGLEQEQEQEQEQGQEQEQE